MEFTAKADNKGDGFDILNDGITFAVLDKDDVVIVEPLQPVGCMIQLTPEDFELCPTEIPLTDIDVLEIELEHPILPSQQIRVTAFITASSINPDDLPAPSEDSWVLKFTVGDDEGETTIKKVDVKAPESDCKP